MTVECPPGACEMGQGCGGPGGTDTPCGSCCDCRGCAALALLVADTPLSRVERFLNILPPGEPVLTAVVVDDEDTVVTLHTSDVRAVIADLWAARDLAFRAAFGDEDGAEVQWGIQYPEDQTVSWVGAEASARSLTHSTPEALRRRVVPPWKPVPAGPVPQEKP